MPSKIYHGGPNAQLNVARSKAFNLDNGAGTTIDDCILRLDKRIELVKAQVVYTDATTGTVAAGNSRVGTTVGGSEIVASTAYENTKAIGTVTAMTLVITEVAENTAVIVRHTGVAITQAGEAYTEVFYRILED